MTRALAVIENMVILDCRGVTCIPVEALADVVPGTSSNVIRFCVKAGASK